MTSPTNLIPHGAYLCPTCGADLLNVTGIHDRGIRKACVGPDRHQWWTPPVEDIYPNMPTARQRYLMECVRGLNWEVHMLPADASIAHLREDKLKAIKMWADMIVRATE